MECGDPTLVLAQEHLAVVFNVKGDDAAGAVANGWQNRCEQHVIWMPRSISLATRGTLLG